ncbi:MAG: hypothetical protein INH41_23875 [Myxococcaceae bacterium]|jgi:hypothetical protein|nr:hypothetical protein [Myxococcaceae bacterium]MCA3015439.1 hypothetical protein [Myxococcaceae bacterium]
MRFTRVFTFAVLSLGVVASAEPRRTLARVVSSEGATVTLEVLEGYVTVGDELELWTEGGKRVTKLTLPVDLVNRGDSAAGVKLSGSAPAAGALLAQKGQYSQWAEAAAALAAIPPKVLARVASVEGATVTLEVLLGSTVPGAELDVLTAEGKTTAKVTLPEGIGLALSGDTLKGVTLAGARVAQGALVSDKGRFSTLAAASAALPGAKVAPPPAVAGPASIKASAAACAFTPAEVSAALGFKVGPGTGTELAFEGGTALSCRWLEEKGLRSLLLNRQVMTRGDAARNRAALARSLAGSVEAIPGDPDGALWQVGQGDLTGVTLHYGRGAVLTEVRVSGVDMKDAASVSAMRRNVLKLRRF